MPFLSSADIIAGDEYLLTEILLRLPAQTLLKFKPVCKHWNFIISSPHFAHHHSRQIPPISGMIFYSWSNSKFEFARFSGAGGHKLLKTSFTFLPFANDLLDVRILQSCNGLLLCSSVQKSTSDLRNYFVYNPTTGKSSTIPPMPSDSKSVGMNLAFDPSKSPHYSIISITGSTISPLHHQINIFGSASRNWRICIGQFIAPFDLVFSNGVYWNRAVHWISPTGTSLCFDTDKERIAEMPGVPHNGGGWSARKCRLFQETNGHLHLVEVYRGCETEVKVFEMERDYSNWFLKYSVDLNGIARYYPEVIKRYVDPCDGIFYAFRVICLCRRENEEDSSMVISIPGGKIIAYNFMHNKFTEITSDNHSNEFSPKMEWLDVYPYVETLACI
ncbi:hypothetical protein Ancab_017727 [Ancistrocladus abbreviatus]